MEILWTIIIGLLLLTLFVVVHEWGHFMAAKKAGIRILEFSVGMGPVLFKRMRGGTQFSVRCLPIGGFVRFYGDEEENSKKPGAFMAAPIMSRLRTFIAGPAMNFLLAFVLAIVFLCFYGDYQPVIYSVESGSPAQTAGLQPGDTITELNGIRVDFMLDMQSALSNTDGESSRVTISRDGRKYSFDIPYKADGSKKIGISGISYDRKVFTLSEALLLSFKWMFSLVREMVAILGTLIFTGQGVQNLAGPVGTISIIGQVVQTGFENILRLASLISINLAVINLLPFPALDGGQIVLLGVEAARRKPVPLRVVGMLNTIGLVLIFAFAVYLTFQDIGRLTGG